MLPEWGAGGHAWRGLGIWEEAGRYLSERFSGARKAWASAHGLITFLQSPCSAGPLMTTGLLDLRLVLEQGQDSTQPSLVPGAGQSLCPGWMLRLGQQRASV